MDVREAVGPLEEGRVCARTSEGSTTVVVFRRRVEVDAVFGEWGWIFVEAEHQASRSNMYYAASRPHSSSEQTTS